MQKTNNWVTTGASLLYLAIALGGISSCDSSPPTSSGIVAQPSPVSSPRATKATTPTAPATVSPPGTITTGTNKPEASSPNASKQNAPSSSPTDTGKQSLTPSTTPKIRVSPDASLSLQLIVEQEDKVYTINAQDLQVEMMNSLNCQKMAQVDRQALTATNFMRDQVSVNPQTGDIAIGVIFQYCALTQESGVVLLKPKADGGYQTTMLQVPGKQALPSNNATYPLGYIKSVRYSNNDLRVSHGNAAGAEAELVFRSGAFVSCRVASAGEGSGNLCP